MRLVVDVKDREIEVEADLTESVEVLRNQVFSLLDVPVDDFDLILVDFGPLSDDIDLSRLVFPTNRVLLRKVVQQLPGDWVECCTALFSDPNTLQPAYKVGDMYVCQGCAGLCQAGNQPEIDIHKEDFRCQCVDTSECLFNCRKYEWYPYFVQKQVQSHLLKSCKSLWNTYFPSEIDQFSLEMRRNRSVVVMYEDLELQEKARKLIPKEALEEKQRNGGREGRDGYLEQLLVWFKTEFFTWMDKPKCKECSEPTENSGYVDPTAEEKLYTARRVETYTCPQGHITRFPRYNHPGKLLETRTGRCGEWANCFGLILKASGYDTRIVLDFTDHVWNEAWSVQQNRWLHCDSCEAKLDSPLLYEQGWGKKLTYIFAESINGVKDVILRYSRDMNDVKTRRNRVPEPWIGLYTKDVTRRLRSGVSSEEFVRLEKRDAEENKELEIPGKEVTQSETQPRESGDLAWRQSRGEMGPAETENTVKSRDASVPKQEERKEKAEKAKMDVKELVGKAFKQLTTGCESKTCSNEHCASSGKVGKTSANEAAALALRLVAAGEFRFCE